MTDNETYGVLGILGVIVMVISIITAINTALVIHLLWLIETESWYVIPMAILIIGFNMLWLGAVAYAMGIGD